MGHAQVPIEERVGNQEIRKECQKKEKEDGHESAIGTKHIRNKEQGVTYAEIVRRKTNIKRKVDAKEMKCEPQIYKYSKR